MTYPETMPALSDAYLQLLVGSGLHIARFKQRLTTEYRQAMAENGFDDPYTALAIGVEPIVSETMVRLGSKDMGELERSALYGNAIGGAETTMNTLQLVNRVYCERAAVPQRLERVEASVDTALRHAHGIAFGSRQIAARNLDAFLNGNSPTSAISNFRNTFHLASTHANGRHATDSFTVSADAEGQLELDIRYARVTNTSKRRCPATYSTIEVAGESNSGLLTFMRAIGDVAIHEIYPTQFTIVELSPSAA